MIAKFSKSSRILKRSEYLQIYRLAKTITGKYIVLDYHENPIGSPKLGITVTKKYGKAHERNRFKRIVREAFRQLCGTLPQGISMNIRPRFLAKEASALVILEELVTLLQHRGTSPS